MSIIDYILLRGESINQHGIPINRTFIKNFNEILKKDFEIRGVFEPIESWLTDGDIDEDKKAFIIEKTGQLKKHKV